MVAALGAGYLAVNSGLQAGTSTSTSIGASTSTSSIEPTSTTASAVSSSGLELRVDLNATTMEPGSMLAANVTLLNTLNETLSLPDNAAENLMNQIFAWNSYDFSCGQDGMASYVLGSALFRGHFSADNFSLAPGPLQVALFPMQLCGSMFVTQTPVVTFSPDSDNASISGSGIPSAPFTLGLSTTGCVGLPHGGSSCHSGSGLFGYWSPLVNSSAPEPFQYFTPGEYTLAAEDLWGDRVFAYFQVTKGPSPSLAVSAQESPFSSEGHPIIGITLADFADVPITSLNATLRSVASLNSSSYPFTFSVNSSDPLLPGQYVQDVRTLQGNPFDIGVSYPLTISGTLANGTEFAYTQQIQFVNSVPS